MQVKENASTHLHICVGRKMQITVNASTHLQGVGNAGNEKYKNTSKFYYFLNLAMN